MVKVKATMVELEVKKDCIKRSFEIKHAERILSMGSTLNGGWELPDDSKYYYDEDNGIRLKTDKANTAKAE
jgi:hypothetical protein